MSTINLSLMGNNVLLTKVVVPATEKADEQVKYVTRGADGTIGRSSKVVRVSETFAQTLEGETFTIGGLESDPIRHVTEWVEGTKGKAPKDPANYADRFVSNMRVTDSDGELVSVTVLCQREKTASGNLLDDYMFSISGSVIKGEGGVGRVKADAVDDPFALIG